MTASPEAFAALARELGYELDAPAADHLSLYLERLLSWNKVMNLVGVHTWQDAVRTLIVDSLVLAPFLDTLPLPQAPMCWDPGAGAGLPGIPLRAIWQRGSYTMIEAREKRALFLSNVLAHLRLPGTHVYRGRLEQYTATAEGKCGADLLLSRAFMPWRELLTTVLPHLRPGGVVVLLLNQIPDKAELAAPINGRHWRIIRHLEYPVQAGPTRKKTAPSRVSPPNNDTRILSRSLLALSPSAD